MPAGDDIWLVLPTYNEAASLESIVAAVRERLPEGATVLVVDDSSPDGTGRVADRLAADLTGGYKVFRREVLEAIDLGSIPSLGYAFQIETTYRAIRSGFRVVELPIVFSDRRVGESKMTASIALEASLRVPAMRLRG